VKVTFREAARDDVIRQYRYFLVTLDRPPLASGFKQQVRATIDLIRGRPLMAPRCLARRASLEGLRSWPVRGFPAIRIYFFVTDRIEVVRILHGKQDVRRILERMDL
jgi:plasmid stabilization system protein ParE